jgi:hypothetical protein
MRKYSVILAVAITLFGCEGEEIKVNEEKLNKAGDKLQKTVEKGADSIGESSTDLKISSIKMILCVTKHTARDAAEI